MLFFIYRGDKAVARLPYQNFDWSVKICSRSRFGKPWPVLNETTFERGNCVARDVSASKIGPVGIIDFFRAIERTRVHDFLCLRWRALSDLIRLYADIDFENRFRVNGFGSNLRS